MAGPLLSGCREWISNVRYKNEEISQPIHGQNQAQLFFLHIGVSFMVLLMNKIPHQLKKFISLSHSLQGFNTFNIIPVSLTHDIKKNMFSKHVKRTTQHSQLYYQKALLYLCPLNPLR